MRSSPRSPGDRPRDRPGTASLGYGLVDRTGSRLRAIDFGAFHTGADLPLPERLLAIHTFLEDLIELHGPTLVGVERIFHSRNVQTALSTMNIPTAGDVKKLEGKIEELEKVFEALSTKITDMQKTEAPPVSNGHDTAPHA